MTNTRRWPLSYGFGLLAVATAVGLAVVPVLKPAGGSLLLMAVLLSAWFGGMGPGLFSVALIGLLLLVGQAAQYSRASPLEPWDLVNHGFFVMFGALISMLIGALHTARRRAEESRRWLAAVLTSIGDAVIATDAQGRVNFTNPVARDLTGWDPEEAAGKPLEHVFQIVSEETREPVEHPVARVFRDGSVVGLANHTLLIARDGTERPIADSAAPIRDESGNIGGVVLAFRDVADHRRWEEALRQSEVEMRRLNAELERRVAQRTAQLEAANEELEAFSYSVAHDLRAPLRAIEGFSRILLDKYPDRLDVLGKDYLERVGAAAKRLEQLIGDLLNLSRLTRSEMRQVTVDLSALAEAVATELQQREPQRRVEFVIAPEVVACGDARLLRFALDNLLGNAWKYTGTREEARIEFGAAPINGQTAYFVRDNGAGFDMAYVEKLFRPFQRLHTEREFPGTGIGLASVKRVVGRHGGRVWAEGAVERGATFYFTLVTRPDSHPASGGTTHGGQIHALGGG
jgi:PAS domain S-box-containing protein